MHLPTTMMKYLIVTLFLLSSIIAAPLQPDKSRHLVERQVIPDRYGNTGNKPAGVASQPTASPKAAPLPTIDATNASSTLSTTTTTYPVITGSTSSSQNALPTSTPASSQISVTTSSTPYGLPSSSWTLFNDMNSPRGLSPITITGIALGCIAFLALIIIALLLLYRRKRTCDIKEITAPTTRSNQSFRHFYKAKIARPQSHGGEGHKEKLVVA